MLQLEKFGVVLPGAFFGSQKYLRKKELKCLLVTTTIKEH